MRTKKQIGVFGLATAITLLGFTPTSFAVDCQGEGAAPVKSDENTTYTPGQGDTKMEGGEGSSTPGFSAKEHTIDNYVKGTAPKGCFSLAAQQGGSQGADLFGAVVRVPEFEQIGVKGPGGQACGCVLDHYAKSENGGSDHAAAGKALPTGFTKFDSSTDQGGKWVKEIPTVKSATYIPTGRAPGATQNRKGLDRNPDATS